MKDWMSDWMKLKPETAAEITDCATPDGMRRRLREYSYRGSEPIVKAIFDASQIRGLSGEDTMTWLAFEALQGLEHMKALMLEKAMLDPMPPKIILDSGIGAIADHAKEISEAHQVIFDLAHGRK